MPTTPGDDVALTAGIIESARQYGRYGYRRITALLRASGWMMNRKRVERIRVARSLKSTEVIEALCDLFVERDVLAHIRSDNDPEFIALALRQWIAAVGAKTAYIEPGSPWENGYCERFNGKLRDELLNSEICYTLKEAKIMIEALRRHYNTVRPHASLRYRPPAPEAIC